MKRVLLAVLLLSVSAVAQMWPMPGPGSPVAAAPPAGGSPAVVNSWSIAGINQAAISLTIAPSAGNKLLVFVVNNYATPAAPTSVVDNLGNGLTQVYTSFYAGTDKAQWAYQYTVPSAGVTSVIINNAAGSNNAYIGIAVEVSGLAASPFDAESTEKHAYVSSLTTNSVTPTYSGTNLLIGSFFAGAGSGVVTAGSGYTAIRQQGTTGATTGGALFVEYKLQTGTAAATASATWPSSQTITAVVSSWKGQ